MGDADDGIDDGSRRLIELLLLLLLLLARDMRWAWTSRRR